jgi:DHA3 family tetracycline resistance protein-like MFS transporter
VRRRDATKTYLASSLVFALFTSVIFTLDMVYQVRVAHLDPLQLVLVGTTLELTALIFEIPTGILADLRGRRLSTIIGFLVVGAGFVLEGLVPRFGPILAAQVLWGLGWTFISGAHDAWIADEVGPERVAGVYMRSAQMGQVGALVGIPLSVALGSGNLSWPIVAGGAGIALWGLVLALAMPETSFHPVPTEERENWRALLSTARQGVSLVRRRPLLMVFMLIGLFMGLSSEGYDRLWTAHVLQNLRFPAHPQLSEQVWFGLLAVVGSLCTLGATELVRRRLNAADGRQVGRLLQGLYGAVIVALIALALSRNLGLALPAIVLINTLRATADPLGTAWMNDHLDSQVRATVLSMRGQVNAVGQVLGGPAVGWLGKAVSLRAALGVVALLWAPIVPLYGRASRIAPPDESQ